MAKPDLTAEALRELLHYDPETGVFTWRVKMWRALAGSIAGHVSQHGYRMIKISQWKWQAHRLAYLYMTGEHPPHDIDHINQIRSDNRWVNLRSATRKQNQENKSNHAMRGIRWDGGKWLVRIKTNGRTIYLARVSCVEEAKEIRRKAELIHFTHSPACGLPGGSRESLVPTGETPSVSPQSPQNLPQQQSA